jgi:hypothetical protein
VNLHVHFIAGPEMSQLHERSIEDYAVRVAHFGDGFYHT